MGLLQDIVHAISGGHPNGPTQPIVDHPQMLPQPMQALPHAQMQARPVIGAQPYAPMHQLPPMPGQIHGQIGQSMPNSLHQGTVYNPGFTSFQGARGPQVQQPANSFTTPQWQGPAPQQGTITF